MPKKWGLFGSKKDSKSVEYGDMEVSEGDAVPLTSSDRSKGQRSPSSKSPKRLGSSAGASKDEELSATEKEEEVPEKEHKHLICGSWRWGDTENDVDFKKNGTFYTNEGMLEEIKDWHDKYDTGIKGTWREVNSHEVECKFDSLDDADAIWLEEVHMTFTLVIDESGLKLKEKGAWGKSERTSWDEWRVKGLLVDPLEGKAGHRAMRLPGTYLMSDPEVLPSACYTFRLGHMDLAKSGAGSDIDEISSLCLTGKTVNFRADPRGCHEAIYVNGTKHGCRGGDMSQSCKFSKSFQIDKATIGLTESSMDAEYGMGIVAGFSDIILKRKEVEAVGAISSFEELEKLLNEDEKKAWKEYLEECDKPEDEQDHEKLKLKGSHLKNAEEFWDRNARSVQVKVAFASSGVEAVHDKYVVELDAWEHEGDDEIPKPEDPRKALKYEYDREKLGLDLVIAGVVVQKSKHKGEDFKFNGFKAVPVEYVFTLSANPGLKFNPEEFNKFWAFLTECRYFQSNVVNPLEKPMDYSWETYVELKQLGRGDEADYQKEGEGGFFSHGVFTRGKDEEEFAKGVLDFESEFSLVKERDCFSAKFQAASTNTVMKNEFFKTKLLIDAERISIAEHKQFYVFVDTVVPYDSVNGTKDLIITHLVIRGRQIDIKQATFGQADFDDNEVIDEVMAVCLSAALNDFELLVEMDFMKQSTKVYSPAQAKEIIAFMAIVGARTVAVEQIMNDAEGWDIYSVAAARQGNHWLAALLCAVIQIIGPIMLINYNLKRVNSEEFFGKQFQFVDGNDMADNGMMIFLRVLFIVYAIAFEGTNIAAGSSELKLSHFLMTLPEFNRGILVAGTVINLFARLFVSFCTIFVLYLSLDPTSVILNALALFFVLSVDNELVSDEMLEELMEVQEEKLYKLKTKYIKAFLDGEPIKEEKVKIFTRSAKVGTCVNVIERHWAFPSKVPLFAGYINVFILGLGGLIFCCAALRTLQLNFTALYGDVMTE